ncbi:MAG: hypothetical protein ABIK23_06050 [candidate division WOR-3 bacterium]
MNIAATNVKLRKGDVKLQRDVIGRLRVFAVRGEGVAYWLRAGGSVRVRGLGARIWSQDEAGRGGV